MIHNILSFTAAAFITFLIVWGLIDLVRTIVISFCKNQNNIYLICPVSGHSENIEFTLRNAVSSAKWLSKLKPRKIIILSSKLDADSEKVCKLFCKDNDILEIKSIESLSQMIDTEIKDNISN